MDSIVFSAAWDRAAATRATAPPPDARVTPMWRGRPMVEGRDLVWLPVDHPLLSLAGPERVRLGLHDAAMRFAADVSRWEPPGLDPAAQAMFLDPTEYRHPDLPPSHRFMDLRAAMVDLAPAAAAMAATARALFNWHRSHRFCSACGQGSVWAMDGWQRDCPACATRHFPRTDPVVIMLVRRGNRVLLGRSPGWPEWMYSALAGFVEPGETFETAVRREVAEEVGIQIGAVRLLAGQPWPFPNSLMLAALADAQGDAIMRDAELEDALWVSREEMVDVMLGQHPRIKPPRKGAIAHWMVTSWLAGRLD